MKGLKCNSCSYPGADIFHYHALSCGGSGSGRLRRHEIFVRALNDLAQAAGFHPIMNAPVKCLRYEKNGVRWLKPADVLIDGEDVDRCCVDVTIVSPLSATKAKHSEGQICGKLVATAADSKVGKHQEDCVRSGMEFLPFAIDVCGVTDTSGWQLINRLAERYSLRQGRPYSVSVSLLRRKLSFALHLGIAKQLSRFFNCKEGYWGEDVVGVV
jgi:hypothetical protein